MNEQKTNRDGSGSSGGGCGSLPDGGTGKVELPPVRGALVYEPIALLN